ncbi:MAG: hypothetical protein N2C12_02430, partial [Planctomycetales bacterium]
MIKLALCSFFIVGICVLPLHANEDSHVELDVVKTNQLSSRNEFANNPAMALSDDGAGWVAWIRHHAELGAVVVVAEEDGKVSVLTESPGQYLRPVMAASGDQLQCVWTQTDHDQVAAVWVASGRNGVWSKPQRLVPGETRAHQNPEISAGPDGRFAVVYQVHDGQEYDIYLKEGDKIKKISEPGTNDWDPTVAFDGSGQVHVAWSGFKDGDYDIYWKRGDSASRRISSRGQYDLHPWLSAAADGRVWATWDAVELPGHANSGVTTIVGANPGHKIPSNYGDGQHSWIEVRVLQGDSVLVPGDPRQQIVPPSGYETSHAALPKIVVGPKGGSWIVYRALHKQSDGSWLPRDGTLYYWDLVARPFRDGRWQDPVRFDLSDGYVEEASVASGPQGICVVYGGEQRVTSPQRLKHFREATSKPDPDNHHSDFIGKVGCNGAVYLAKLQDRDEEALELATAPPLQDQAMPSRSRAEPYEVKVNNKSYRLL